jgi:hypothetical protein
MGMTETGSAVLCELVDLLGETVAALDRLVAEVFADDQVDAEERRVVLAAVAELRQGYAPLPGATSGLHGVLRLIKCLAHTGAVTPWVERMVREEAADGAAIARAA